jgi:hypothetical protein
MNTLLSETHHSLSVRPTWLLRFEGAVVLYATHSGNWLLFALLFYAPYLFALGYLPEKRQP